MQKLDRLLSIVLMLHGKSVVRAEDLARHFGVSARTIYRDMNTLSEAGVPIASEAGIGYSLVKGYTLPPVMFSNEEATALIIGAEFLGKFSSSDELTNHSASAVAKILSIVPDATKERIHVLQNTTAVFAQRTTSTFSVPTVFSDLQRAISERKCVEIQYSTASQESTTRTIEPLGMVYYGGYWHCIAHCQLRNDKRDFRADRILSLTISDTLYNPHIGFAVVDFLREQYSSENPITIRVLFSRTSARFVSNKHYFGFVREEIKEDGVEMIFLVSHIYAIGRWLLGYGDSVDIIEPIELRLWMKEKAAAALAKLSE